MVETQLHSHKKNQTNRSLPPPFVTTPDSNEVIRFSRLLLQSYAATIAIELVSHCWRSGPRQKKNKKRYEVAPVSASILAKMLMEKSVYAYQHKSFIGAVKTELHRRGSAEIGVDVGDDSFCERD